MSYVTLDPYPTTLVGVEKRGIYCTEVVGGNHRRLTLKDVHDTFITIRQYLMQKTASHVQDAYP